MATGGGGSEVFQVDSTSTRLSSTTTPTLWVTLTGDAKVLHLHEIHLLLRTLVRIIEEEKTDGE